MLSSLRSYDGKEYVKKMSNESHLQHGCAPKGFRLLGTLCLSFIFMLSVGLYSSNVSQKKAKHYLFGANKVDPATFQKYHKNFSTKMSGSLPTSYDARDYGIV